MNCIKRCIESVLEIFYLLTNYKVLEKELISYLELQINEIKRKVVVRFRVFNFLRVWMVTPLERRIGGEAFKIGRKLSASLLL